MNLISPDLHDQQPEISEPWKDIPDIASVQFALQSVANSVRGELIPLKNEVFAYQRTGALPATHKPQTIGEVVSIYQPQDFSAFKHPFNLLDFAADVLQEDLNSADKTDTLFVLSQLRVEKIAVPSFVDLAKLLEIRGETKEVCIVLDDEMLHIRLENNKIHVHLPRGSYDVEAFLENKFLLHNFSTEPSYQVLVFTPLNEINFEAREGLLVPTLSVSDQDYDVAAAAENISRLKNAGSYVFEFPQSSEDYPRIRASVSVFDKHNDFSAYEAIALLTLWRKTTVDESYTGEFRQDVLASRGEQLGVTLPEPEQISRELVLEGVNSFIRHCLTFERDGKEIVEDMSKAILTRVQEEYVDRYNERGEFTAGIMRKNIALGAAIARDIYLSALNQAKRLVANN